MGSGNGTLGHTVQAPVTKFMNSPVSAGVEMACSALTV